MLGKAPHVTSVTCPWPGLTHTASPTWGAGLRESGTPRRRENRCVTCWSVSAKPHPRKGVTVSQFLEVLGQHRLRPDLFASLERPGGVLWPERLGASLCLVCGQGICRQYFAGSHTEARWTPKPLPWNLGCQSPHSQVENHVRKRKTGHNHHQLLQTRALLLPPSPVQIPATQAGLSRLCLFWTLSTSRASAGIDVCPPT